MLDMHTFNRRQNAIRNKIGVKRNYPFLSDAECYSCYFNPSNNNLTGIRDNERNIFYHYTNQGDIIDFVGMINHKAFRYSSFMEKLELTLKEYVDREIELFDEIHKLEDKIIELKDENQDLKHKLTMQNVEL